MPLGNIPRAMLVPGRGKKSTAEASAMMLPSSSEASSVADAGAATPSSLRDSSVGGGVSMQSSATPPAALRGSAGDGGATDTSQSLTGDGRAPAVLTKAGPGSASDTDASVECGRSTAAASLRTATSRRLRRAASSGLSDSITGASAQQPAVAAAVATANGISSPGQQAESRDDAWPPTEEVLRMALQWLQEADELASIAGTAPTTGAAAAPASRPYLSVHKVAALLAGALRLCASSSARAAAYCVQHAQAGVDRILWSNVQSWYCNMLNCFVATLRTHVRARRLKCDFTICAVAPPSLQADVVMLVPRLVAPAEHTQAAGALLGRLAEASRQGPGSEADLRLPVLAALGRLRIDPAVADRVLHAALAVRAWFPVAFRGFRAHGIAIVPQSEQTTNMRHLYLQGY